MSCDSRSVIAALAIVLWSPAARAQSAEAEVLFRDGKQLIRNGKLEEGCAKFEASQRAESSVGTLLNLGDCREKLGQFASAWAAFRKAEAQAKLGGTDEKRRAEARRRITLLEPKLSHLVVQIEARVRGLVVRRAGEAIDPALWNTAVPVDPGAYELVAEAPGHKAWATKVAIEGKTKRRVVVTVPALEAAPADEPRAVKAKRVASTPVPPELPEVSLAPSPVPPAAPVIEAQEPDQYVLLWTTPRRVSVVVAGASALALVTGAYFGWRAQDLERDADRRCPMTACGDPEALKVNERARDAALRANISYVAGGTAAAVAVVLWFVGKPRVGVISPGTGSGLGIEYAGSF